MESFLHKRLLREARSLYAVFADDIRANVGPESHTPTSDDAGLHVGAGSVLHDVILVGNVNVTIGKNCVVEHVRFISNAMEGVNIVIGDNTVLRNCTVYGDVPENCIIYNTDIPEYVSLSSGSVVLDVSFNKPEVTGEALTIGKDAVLVCASISTAGLRIGDRFTVGAPFVTQQRISDIKRCRYAPETNTAINVYRDIKMRICSDPSKSYIGNDVVVAASVIVPFIGSSFTMADSSKITAVRSAAGMFYFKCAKVELQKGSTVISESPCLPNRDMSNLVGKRLPRDWKKSGLIVAANSVAVARLTNVLMSYGPDCMVRTEYGKVAIL